MFWSIFRVQHGVIKIGVKNSVNKIDRNKKKPYRLVWLSKPRNVEGDIEHK